MMIGMDATSKDLQVAYLSLIPPNSSSSGPAIRPLGTAEGAGAYSSDKSSNGNIIAPWLCSQLRVGASRTNGQYVTWTVSDASPEGAQSAIPGSMHSDKTNGVLYMKSTGTGNTGWVAVSTA